MGVTHCILITNAARYFTIHVPLVNQLMTLLSWKVDHWHCCFLISTPQVRPHVWAPVRRETGDPACSLSPPDGRSARRAGAWPTPQPWRVSRVAGTARGYDMEIGPDNGFINHDAVVFGI